MFEPKAWFRAVVADDVPVGFVMLSVDEAAPEYYLWRFMIDERYQGRGYGRAAIGLLIDHVRTLPRRDRAARQLEPEPRRPRAVLSRPRLRADRRGRRGRGRRSAPAVRAVRAARAGRDALCSSRPAAPSPCSTRSGSTSTTRPTSRSRCTSTACGAAPTSPGRPSSCHSVTACRRSPSRHVSASGAVLATLDVPLGPVKALRDREGDAWGEEDRRAVRAHPDHGRRAGPDRGARRRPRRSRRDPAPDPGRIAASGFV